MMGALRWRLWQRAHEQQNPCRPATHSSHTRHTDDIDHTNDCSHAHDCTVAARLSWRESITAPYASKSSQQTEGTHTRAYRLEEINSECVFVVLLFFGKSVKRKECACPKICQKRGDDEGTNYAIDQNQNWPKSIKPNLAVVTRSVRVDNTGRKR